MEIRGIKMSKLEETNKVIDAIVELEKAGIKVDYAALLADVAKSLAMIADKLHGEVENENDD